MNSKIIINNHSDLSDEVAVEEVLKIIKKGRKMKGRYISMMMIDKNHSVNSVLTPSGNDAFYVSGRVTKNG